MEEPMKEDGDCDYFWDNWIGVKDSDDDETP
jgi:hypothetical protein